MRRFFLAFDAAVLVILAVQGWSLVRVARRRPRRSRRVPPVILAVGPLLWELGAGLAILLGFPGLSGMTWEQSLRAMPDLTLVLLALSGRWLVTGVARSARLLQGVRRTGLSEITPPRTPSLPDRQRGRRLEP
jgi:hypothetical protein